MSKPSLAVAFAVLIGWSALAGAADLSKPVVLVRDPLMDSPSAGASLPELGGGDASRDFRDLQPRPLPGQRAPLDFGPRPYWESNPLFTTPPR
jgi:hypothetical protein